MELAEEIVLRPRFKIDLDRDAESALLAFEEAKKEENELVITRVDNHVFIKLPKDKQHFWSPQLDLEISGFEPGKSVLRGLFGPKPAVWTMFMFFHFVVATLFIAAGVWAYSIASLEEPITVQITIMVLLVLVWFVLYFAGRMGKAAGKDEMRILHRFMRKTLQL